MIDTKRSKRKTEGGKTFNRLDDNSMDIYYLVYDSKLNMVTESQEDQPLQKGNVLDTEFNSFGMDTYQGMIDEAKKLGIKR